MNIDIRNCDCYELLKSLPDESVDFFLQDIPYNTTANAWEYDIVPLLSKFWEQWLRVGKRGCVFAFTATMPIMIDIVNSNRKMFKHDWIWKKSTMGNIALSKFQPLREHEYILIFSEFAAAYTSNGKSIEYFPQMTMGEPYYKANKNKKAPSRSVLKEGGEMREIKNNGVRFPKTILDIPNSNYNSPHPTSKPLELFEYLIKTYTKEGYTVFDGFLGGGTTAIACKKLKRNFIGCELFKEYYDISVKRVEETVVSYTESEMENLTETGKLNVQTSMF